MKKSLTTIYLDQNCLSELRKRKRQYNSAFLKIYNLIKKDNVFLLYSHVHLAEIKQIPKQEYIDEHIDLLCDLQAIYVKPMMDGLDSRSPRVIWEEYLVNESDNDKDRSNEVSTTLENFSKKLSGLPVESDFSDLTNELEGQGLHFINEVINGLNELTLEELANAGIDKEEVIRQLTPIKKEGLQLEPLQIPDEEQLGPKQFREWIQQKGIDIEKLPAKDVVPVLDQLFTETTGHPVEIGQNYDGVQSLLIKAYTLMNWAGYYPDDFTKIKRNKDRFRASNYDMMHANQAMTCTYLVSNDVDFSKKAKACYAYINAETKVITPTEFISLRES